jgi:hypothetical protein
MNLFFVDVVDTAPKPSKVFFLGKFLYPVELLGRL